MSGETVKLSPGCMMALRRDSLRLRLLPARSIEDTGLDPSLYGGILSPHGALNPGKEAWSTTALRKPIAESPMAKEKHVAQPQMPVCSKCQQEEKPRLQESSDVGHLKGKEEDFFANDQKLRRRVKKGKGLDFDSSSSREVTFVGQEENTSRAGFSHKELCKPPVAEGDLMQGSVGLLTLEKDISNVPHDNTFGDHMDAKFEKVANLFKKKGFQEFVSTSVDVQEVDSTSFMIRKDSVLDLLPDDFSTHRTLSFDLASATVPQIRTLEEAENSEALDASPSSSCASQSIGGSPGSTFILQPKNVAASNIDVPQKEFSRSVASSKGDARSRWKRAAHSVKFINHLAANIRVASTDLLQQQVTQDDAGGVGAAAFEGAKTVARLRSKGRKGMEGLLVRQDKGFISFFQDFYVACLKMPIGHFLVGVFLAPLVLGLLFTPLYLLDVDGLSFNGVVPEDATTSPFVSAQQRCLTFLNIFLYALSLSTTFGGAPVAARSPFCLLVANMNTLLAQFLFVFLSGAVFARMSQPSYPIRCSKKAIIKTDDLLPVLGLEQQEKFKVFAVRLVLTGPSPCELVDAKICLTFRIFVTLPTGSVFCSTQDLELVRPEVSYLRYGLMVRHIIDKKSPVYGHTMESLYEGDASFSLTVMGMERTSMQPVFHLEDYFVCDDDVIWEGDYEDFIHVDNKGQRVLDHSQIDRLKPMKAAARASQAVSRLRHLSLQKQEEAEKTKEPKASEEVKQVFHNIWPSQWFKLRKRKLLKSMSTSFTRADW